MKLLMTTLNYIKRCSKQKVPRHLTMTKRFLKEHELLAVPFDKGTGICLMKSTTYKNKIAEILQLRQFEKIQITRKNAKNMSVKEEERINDILQELLDTHEIDETLFEDMKSMGWQLPRSYGLAKVHKPKCTSTTSSINAGFAILQNSGESYKVVVDGSRIENQLLHKENRRPTQECDSRS